MSDYALIAYARTQLLRTAPAAQRDDLEAFLHSTTFHHLAGGFNKVLEQAMHAFVTQPGPAPVMPAADFLQPLPFKDLSAPGAPAPAGMPALSILPDIGFRLPDARAGAAYRQPLEAVPVSEDKVCFCDLAARPDAALAVENATGIVTGTLATAGDYTLTVTYHYATEPGQLRHAIVLLAVMPTAAVPG